MRPFPPPERKWEEISMDFIFQLPKTKEGNTGILAVVDKLTKRAHFIPLKQNHTAGSQPNYSIKKYTNTMDYPGKLSLIDLFDLLEILEILNGNPRHKIEHVHCFPSRN